MKDNVKDENPLDDINRLNHLAMKDEIVNEWIMDGNRTPPRHI